jgi:DNA-binding YbaB/EbfC family protein
MPELSTTGVPASAVISGIGAVYLPGEHRAMPGVDLNYFIRQANKLTEKIEKRKADLANETVEGKAGDGLVVVVATGTQEVKSVKIDKKAIDPNDSAMLEDLVTAAVNAAISASKELERAELSKISGGIKIPGMT